MPTLYVDSPLLSIVRQRKREMERKAEEDVYVSEQEALETMFNEDATQAVERERESHGR